MRMIITLEEIIELTKEAIAKAKTDKRCRTEFRFTVNQVAQLLKWLEDYKQLRDANSLGEVTDEG